jgi:multidrug resistance efflux pump
MHMGKNMHRPRPLIPIVVLLIAGVLWWAFARPAGTPGCPVSGAICASGTIEADAETVIAAEVSGTIVELPLDEGDAVRAGDLLVRLDDALMAARIRQGEAAVAVAQASLDQLAAGARPEDRKAAAAAVDQARAVSAGAEAALRNAKIMRDDPQEINGRIAAARADADVARAQLALAMANLEVARLVKEQVDKAMATVDGGFIIDTPSGRQHADVPPAAMAELRAQAGLASNQWWTANEAVKIAQASVDGAQAALAELLVMKADPIVLDAQVNAAQAAYDSSVAAVAAARARQDLIEAGPTVQQVAVARAQVDQARAAVGSLRVQAGKLTVRAPDGGIVVSRPAHVGEMAAPGAALLTIARLDTVRVTLYVAVAELGGLVVGDLADVSVDSFKGVVFPGMVTYISPRAEFTPRNVQTREGRTSMVFAVRVDIPNGELKLKPGMPADAVIRSR